MEIRISIVVVLAFAVAAVGQNKPNVSVVPAPYTSPTSGQDMYRAYCSACHGLTGKGDGPAANSLKKAPANLTLLSAHNGGKFPALHVQQTIRGDANVPAHGSKDMPIWGRVFSAMSTSSNKDEVRQRIYTLTQYLKKIQEP